MLAIIPARSGSKGIEGKNIKLLNGKPLIYYSIIAAKQSRNIDRVIVSTDSEEIANIAIDYGAEVPFLRPIEISGDDSPILDNYNFMISCLEKKGEKYNSFAALQPTSPLRNAEDIDNAIELFLRTKADSVISFVEESHSVEWNRVINQNGTFRDIGFSAIKNRQKYKKTFRFNGAVYVLKTSLIRNNKIYSNNSQAYIMPFERSIDIDNLHDFQYAEFLLNKSL